MYIPTDPQKCGTVHREKVTEFFTDGVKKRRKKEKVHQKITHTLEHVDAIQRTRTVQSQKKVSKIILLLIIHQCSHQDIFKVKGLMFWLCK